MLRGDVYRLRSGRTTGHELRGERFAVVVHTQRMLPRSVVLIAPTSASAWEASYRPAVEVAGAVTRVLVEHLQAADVSRLGDLVGHLAPEEMWGVDKALRAVLGL